MNKDPEFRLEGAKGLRFFKTEKNIELLKALLNDPEAHAERVSAYDVKPEVLKIVYPIRNAAYEALTKWEVVVEKPVLEKPYVPAE